MSADVSLDQLAENAAEEILRRIYGDDLKGCTISFDSVTSVIRDALEKSAGEGSMVMEVLRKGFEAVQLLSTPPSNGQELNPEELHRLLGERLDTIQTLATRIINTTGQEQERSSGKIDPPAPNDHEARE